MPGIKLGPYNLRVKAIICLHYTATYNNVTKCNTHNNKNNNNTMYASHVFYTKEIRHVVYVPLLTNGRYNRG